MHSKYKGDRSLQSLITFDFKESIEEAMSTGMELLLK